MLGGVDILTGHDRSTYPCFNHPEPYHQILLQPIPDTTDIKCSKCDSRLNPSKDSSHTFWDTQGASAQECEQSIANPECVFHRLNLLLSFLGIKGFIWVCQKNWYPKLMVVICFPTYIAVPWLSPFLETRKSCLVSSLYTCIHIYISSNIHVQWSYNIPMVCWWANTLVDDSIPPYSSPLVGDLYPIRSHEKSQQIQWDIMILYNDDCG